MEKIKAKRFAVAEICFRIFGYLYNRDYIIISGDTFDFVGHIGDDYIFGKYSEEEYEVSYYKGIKKEKLLSFTFNLKKETIKNGSLIEVREDDFSFEILSYNQDIDLATRVYNYNLEFLDCN